MPRLREIKRTDIHAKAEIVFKRLFGDRDPITQPGTATGTKGNWWSVFACSADIFDHAVAGFQVFHSPDRKVPASLRELGKTRAGWARGSQFVYSQHCKASRIAGLTEEQIRAIPNWQIADCFSPLERAVLAYTDALVLQGGRVPEDVFAALRRGLSDEGILELTYVTAMYDMHSVIAKALRLEYDDVDDRVVEVAAPSAGAIDVMSMVGDVKR